MSDDEAVKAVAKATREAIDSWRIHNDPADDNGPGLPDVIAPAAIDVLRRIGWSPHYTSTYCIHENHGECRLHCKTCKWQCRCVCHSQQGSNE